MVAGIEDYSSAIVIPQMVKAARLQGGAPVLKNDRPLKYSGGCCVVFPFETPTEKYAVRFWHNAVGKMQERAVLESQAIASSGLPYFANFEYDPEALMTACGPQPAAIMDWVEAEPLKQYLGKRMGQSSKLDALAANFLKMTKDLHSASLSHGDLHHGNILVQTDGTIVLVDSDSMFVPGMEGFIDEIKGAPGYQPPARKDLKYLSPLSDYFSELVIYTSLKALSRHPGLWQKLKMADSDSLLFTEMDIKSGGASEIFGFLESDRELRPLGRAIKDALRQTSINNIVPLECVVNDPKDVLVSSISAKWGDNGYLPMPIINAIDHLDIVSKVADLW